jgi:hypothetical protein
MINITLLVSLNMAVSEELKLSENVFGTRTVSIQKHLQFSSQVLNYSSQDVFTDAGHSC